VEFPAIADETVTLYVPAFKFALTPAKPSPFVIA
jgi:hypothetical protein